jgi:hypothetical protein
LRIFFYEIRGRNDAPRVNLYWAFPAGRWTRTEPGRSILAAGLSGKADLVAPAVSLKPCQKKPPVVTYKITPDSTKSAKIAAMRFL